MVSLGASVSTAPDQEPETYGATLIRFHDAAGREVRSEVRGRELEVLDIVLFIELDDGERVSTPPGEIRLIGRLDGTMDELRERVEQMVYDDGDRWPRWRNLMAALKSRGVDADDPAIATLPLILEFTDEVLALYGSGTP
jgi:hypothetical protein